MNILITGCAGFIGRNLVATLGRLNVTAMDVVEGFDVLPLFRSDTSHYYDLVIHAAAVAPHRLAIDGAPLTVGTRNLILDAEMFAWAALTKPGRVVYISSSAAYPVAYQDGAAPYRLREDDIDLHAPEHPDAIYGQVKLTGEHLAAAYRRQGGAVTVVRPFSGYGTDQSEAFPFGAFRERARRRADPFTVWGDGEQVRDWIHVDDVVGAILAAAREGVDEPMNIATGIGTSLNGLAAMLTKEAGYSPDFERHPDAPKGVDYRVGDPTRMLEIYRPKVTLEEGVHRALASAA